jgi:hypothetical protein
MGRQVRYALVPFRHILPTFEHSFNLHYASPLLQKLVFPYTESDLPDSSNHFTEWFVSFLAVGFDCFDKGIFWLFRQGGVSASPFFRAVVQ